MCFKEKKILFLQVQKHTKMGCVKLHILDQQYKNSELKVSYINKKLTSDFCVEKERREILLRYTDPDGRDEWEINENGRIIRHIKNDAHDAFYRIDRSGNRIEGQSIHFDYGTITDYKKQGIFNRATSFSVTNETDGADLFNFFSRHTTETEFGLINTSEHGSTVMTNHLERQVGVTDMAKKMKTVTSIVHSHHDGLDPYPTGFRPRDTDGDRFSVNNFGSSVKHYVYVPKGNSLIRYDANQYYNFTPWSSVFTNTRYK